MKKGSDLTLMRIQTRMMHVWWSSFLVKEQELHKLYLSEGLQAIDQS